MKLKSIYHGLVKKEELPNLRRNLMPQERMEKREDDRGLTAQKIKQLFEYRDGNLYWKKRSEDCFNRKHYFKRWNTCHEGKIAGCKDSGGYVFMKLYGKIHQAHRIVFLLVHGFITKRIDHIDGNVSNNRVENLRPATHSQNMWNSKILKNNTSGIRGVTWNKKEKKWIARIQFNNRTLLLGSFCDKEEAINIRKDAQKKLYGEFSYTSSSKAILDDSKEKANEDNKD